MMNEKLVELLKDTIQLLPRNYEQESFFVVDKTNLLWLEDAIFETEMISVTKMWHYYNDYYRVELLDFCTNKHFYKILGLLLMNSILYDKVITINLKNQTSFIKQIRIGNGAASSLSEGLAQQPIQYNYWAKKIASKHPFQENTVFPNFHLLMNEDELITEISWNERNILHINGSNKVLADLAALLLNIGNPANHRDEIVLECAEGFGGVSSSSVEIRFWLPGSFGWNDDSGILS